MSNKYFFKSIPVSSTISRKHSLYKSYYDSTIPPGKTHAFGKAFNKWCLLVSRKKSLLSQTIPIQATLISLN